MCIRDRYTDWTRQKLGMVKSRKRKEKKCVHIFCFLDNISLMVCALVLLPWTWYSTDHSHHSYNASYWVINELSLLSHSNRKPICIFFVQPSLIISWKFSVCSRETTTIQRQHMDSKCAGHEVLGRKHLQNGNLNFSLLSINFCRYFLFKL